MLRIHIFENYNVKIQVHLEWWEAIIKVVIKVREINTNFRSRPFVEWSDLQTKLKSETLVDWADFQSSAFHWYRWL